MNKFEYINKNLERIRNDIKIGLVNTSVLSQFAVYKIYIKYLEEGFKKGESTKLASKDNKVSMHYVQRVRKDMEREWESEAHITEEIELLRKQLAKKGYSLVGSGKNGYAIKDKYSKVATRVSSLDDVNRFLREYWEINHLDKIIKKKIPPINN